MVLFPFNHLHVKVYGAISLRRDEFRHFSRRSYTLAKIR